MKRLIKAASNAIGSDSDSKYISSVHLRDTLLPHPIKYMLFENALAPLALLWECSAQKRKLWEKVEKILGLDTRIARREEFVRGEKHCVYEWVGPLDLASVMYSLSLSLSLAICICVLASLMMLQSARCVLANAFGS